jgi:hypothetical protein
MRFITNCKLRRGPRLPLLPQARFTGCDLSACVAVVAAVACDEPNLSVALFCLQEQLDIFVGNLDSSDDSSSAVVIAPVVGMNVHHWHGTEVGGMAG